jgi:hypothetical protein
VRNGRRGKPVVWHDVGPEAYQSCAAEGGLGRGARRGANNVCRGGAGGLVDERRWLCGPR